MTDRKKAPSVGRMQGPAPVYLAREKTPLTGSRKGTATRKQNAAAAAGLLQRKQWEATPQGQSRMRSPEMMRTVVEGPALPGRSQATVENPKSHYRENGFSDDATHPSGQATLPGMESLASGRRAGLVSAKGGGTTLPDTVDVARERHLSPGESVAVEQHAARFGVTRESAKRAFAVNLDQAFSNAPTGTRPHAMEFYTDPSPSQPRGHILEAAKASGRPVSAIATATSITSPQTEWGPTKDGHYPNIRAARTAAMHLGPSSEVPQPTLDDNTTKKVGTFRGNVARAVEAVRQQAKGTLAADLRTPAGATVFGGSSQQKTTAFRNALVDPEGPAASLVSDVHTGGRGFAPHLGPEEAGAYLSHPAVHQWHDSIAREVMAERGLQSVNKTQAAQWGQAQIDSGGSSVSHATAFPKPAPKEEVPGQMSLGHMTLGKQFAR